MHCMVHFLELRVINPWRNGPWTEASIYLSMALLEAIRADSTAAATGTLIVIFAHHAVTLIKIPISIAWLPDDQLRNPILSWSKSFKLEVLWLSLGYFPLSNGIFRLYAFVFTCLGCLLSVLIWDSILNTLLQVSLRLDLLLHGILQWACKLGLSFTFWQFKLRFVR